MDRGTKPRLSILEESHSVQNSNLSRLIANLSRQNLSIERTAFIVCNSVYSFITATSTQYLSNNTAGRQISRLEKTGTTAV